MMKASEFAKKCREVAENYETVYIKGGFGAVIAEGVLGTLSKLYPKWYTTSKMKKLRALFGKEYFGFDCCGLIKGILWGWNGDAGKVYGGAAYTVNGVPDLDDQGMIEVCKDVSADFSEIEVGECLWMQGHVGVYIGEGLAVECTNKTGWKDGVQITAVLNIGTKVGYNGRKWTKHGKLPWVDYTAERGCAVGTFFPSLKRGDKNDTVRALQILLIGYGFSCGSSGVDGSFGPATLEAVSAYRAAKGLEKTDVCDTAMWRQLLAI